MAVGDNFDTTKKGQKNAFLTNRVSGHGPTKQPYMVGTAYASQENKSDDNLGHPCNAGCGCAELAEFNPRTLGESGCLLPPELTIKLAAASSRDYARQAMTDPKNEGDAFKTFHLKYHNGAWRGRRCCQIEDGVELCDPCEITTHLDGLKSHCNFFGKEGTGRELPIGLPEESHAGDPTTKAKARPSDGVTSRFDVFNRIGLCTSSGEKYTHPPSGKVGYMTEEQCKGSFGGDPANNWIMTGERGCSENGELVPKLDPHCYVLDPNKGSDQFSMPLPTGWFQAENVIFADNEGDCETGEAVQKIDLNTGKIERIGRCVCVEGCEKSLADVPTQAGDEVWKKECGGDVVFDNKFDCEDYKSVCFDTDNKKILDQYTKSEPCLTAPNAGECSDTSHSNKEDCEANDKDWTQKYIWVSNSVIYGNRKWHQAQCVEFDAANAKCASPEGWKLAKDCKRNRGPRYIPADEKNVPFQDTIVERYECLSTGACWDISSGENLSSKEAHCTEPSISDPTACRTNGYTWIEFLSNQKECEEKGTCSDNTYDDDKCKCLEKKETFTPDNVWKENVWTTKWYHNIPDGSGCCSGFFISEGTSGTHQPAVAAEVVGQDTCVNCYEEVILMDVSDMNLSKLPALASEGVGAIHYSQDGDGRGSGELALVWRSCDFCKSCTGEENGAGESKILFLPLNQILNCTDVDLQHYEDTAYEWANPIGRRSADMMACSDTSMGGQWISNLDQQGISGDCNVYLYYEGAVAAGVSDPKTRSVLAEGEYETRLLNMQKQPFKLSEQKQCNYKTADEANGDSWTIPAALGFQYGCRIKDTKFWFDHDIAPMAGWWQSYRARWKAIKERKDFRCVYDLSQPDQTSCEDNVGTCINFNGEQTSHKNRLECENGAGNPPTRVWHPTENSWRLTGVCLGNRVSGKDCCGGSHEYCNYCGPCAADLEALVETILNDKSVVFPTTRPGSFDYWKRTGLHPECPGTGKGTGFSSYIAETCYGVEKRGTIQFASNTKPIVIKSVGHGLISGDAVRIDGVNGNFAANILTKGIYEELQWGSKKGRKCESECTVQINPQDPCTTCPHAGPPGKERPEPMWIVDVVNSDHFIIRDCNGKDSDGRVTVHMGKERACGEVTDIPGYGTTTELSQSDPLTGESGSKVGIDVWECCPHTGTWELYTDTAGVLGGGTDTNSGTEGWHLRGTGFLKQDDRRPEIQDWYVDISPNEVCPTCCDHWMPPSLIATVGDPGTTILNQTCGVDCNGDKYPALKAGYMGSAHCSPLGYCTESDGSIGDQNNSDECETAFGTWTAFNSQSTCEIERCWSNSSKSGLGDPLPQLGDEEACEDRDRWPGTCQDPSYVTIDSCQEAGQEWRGTTVTNWSGAVWTPAGFVQFKDIDGKPGQWFGDGHCCDCTYDCTNPETGQSGMACGCRKCENRTRFLDKPVCRSGAPGSHTDAQDGYCKDDHCCSCECCPGDSKRATFTSKVDYPTLNQFVNNHGDKCVDDDGNHLCVGNLCCKLGSDGDEGGTCLHNPLSNSFDEGQCYPLQASKTVCVANSDCMWQPESGKGNKKFYDKKNGGTACAGFFNNRPMSCEAGHICADQLPEDNYCAKELIYSSEAGCVGLDNALGKARGHTTPCPLCDSALVTGCDRFQYKPQKEACPGLGTMDVLLEWNGFKWISDWTPMKPDSGPQLQPGAPGCYIPPFVGGRQCLHHKVPDWMLEEMDTDNPWFPPFCTNVECNFCGNCETTRFEHNVPPGPTPCPTAKSSVFYVQLELGCGSALDPGGHGYPTFDSYFEHGLSLKANITTCEYNATINAPCPNPLACGNLIPQMGPIVQHRSIPGVNCGPSAPCTECCDFERPGQCRNNSGEPIEHIKTEYDCDKINGANWIPPATDGCGRSGKVFGSDPAACMELRGGPPNDGAHRAFRKQPDVFEVFDVQYAAGPKIETGPQKGEYSDIITARSVGTRPCVWYENDAVSIGLADRTAAETGGKYFHSNNVGGLVEGDMLPSTTDVLSANSEYPSSTFLVVDPAAPKQVGGAHDGRRIALKMPVREQVAGLLHAETDEYDHHQFMQFYVADANALTGHNRHINRNLYRGGLDTIPPDDWKAGNYSRHRGGMNYPGDPQASTFGAKSLTHEPWPYGDGSYPVAPQSQSMAVPMESVYQPYKPIIGPLTSLFRIGKRMILGNIGHKDHVLNQDPIIDPDGGTIAPPPVSIQPVPDGEGGGHLNEIKSIEEEWNKVMGINVSFSHYTIETAFPHDLITGEKIWLDAIWSNAGQCTFNKGVITGEGEHSACYDQTGTHVIRSELGLNVMKETNENPLTNLPYDDLDCADTLHWPLGTTSTTWETEKEYIRCLGAPHCEKWVLKVNQYTNIEVDQDYCMQPTFGLCRDNEKNGLLVKSDDGYCTVEGLTKEDCGTGSKGGEWFPPSFDVLDKETCELLADRRGKCSLEHERTREKSSCIGGICEKGERTETECVNAGYKWLHGHWVEKKYEWMEGPGKWENSGFFTEGCAASMEAEGGGSCDGCYLRCVKQNWFMDSDGGECDPKKCCGREDFCPTSELNGEWVVEVIDNTHFIPRHPLYADPEPPMKSGYVSNPQGLPNLIGKEYDPSNGSCVTGSTANPPYVPVAGYDSQENCEDGGHLWLLDNPPVNTRWSYDKLGVPVERPPGGWDSFAPGYPQGSDVGTGNAIGQYGEFFKKKGTCIKEVSAGGVTQKRNVTEDFPTKTQCTDRNSSGTPGVTYTWVDAKGGIQGLYNGVWTRHGGVFKIVVGSHDGLPWPGKNCRQAGGTGPVDLDFWFLEMPEACCNIHTPLQDNVCGSHGYPGYGPSSGISEKLDGAALLVNIHELAGGGGRTGSIKRKGAE